MSLIFNKNYMKKIYFLFAITGLVMCLLNFESFAQDKSVDFSLGSNGFVYNVSACGDNNFYMVYGKQLLSKKAPKYLMKFDKDMKEVWKQPITFSGANEIEIYTYIKPSDSTMTSYLFGSEQFLQVLPDWNYKRKSNRYP